MHEAIEIVGVYYWTMVGAYEMVGNSGLSLLNNRYKSRKKEYMKYSG
jgi:hypothetical protein